MRDTPTSIAQAPRELLSASAAARYIGLAPQTLAEMRVKGNGPPYMKISGRRVLYSLADIHTWLDQRRRRSTSEPAAIGREP